MPQLTGTPSAAGNGDSSDPDDQFAGMGLPIPDEDGPDLLQTPIGVFDAVCQGVKPINSANFHGLAVEFTLTDPDFAGEEYALLAAAIDPSDTRADAKKKHRKWMRIGQACVAMGQPVDPQTQVPLEGWASLAGLHCRLAVSTYGKNGENVPTIVWGKPKARQSSGREVGFPADLADDYGKFADYGCGVLPAE